MSSAEPATGIRDAAGEHTVCHTLLARHTIGRKELERSAGPRKHFSVGVVWCGRPEHKNDNNRSLKLSTLLPLLDCDASFISLQREVRPCDTAVLKDRTDLLHFGDELNNFSETAALISNLDLVISVDTSVAHLAGALGKPVWIFLPYVPDWRWLLDREDSPWYPTARLFRQNCTRTWDDVIIRVRDALHHFAPRRLLAWDASGPVFMGNDAEA